MKRLSNVDLRVLYLRRHFLQGFIHDMIPEYEHALVRATYSTLDQLIDQIDTIREEIKEIVGDPQFDTQVSVITIPSHINAKLLVYPSDPASKRDQEEIINRVSRIAKELLRYIDGVLSIDLTPKTRELQQSRGKGGNIFIGHGRNEIVRHEVKDFIRDRCGLDPLVLQELPSAGMTVIEKLEKYGRIADYAILILTGDDITAEGEARARQNVILELGWFQGVLGRNRTAILLQTGVELFSNISGVVYLEFTGDAVEGVFEGLRKELEEAGLL